MSQRVQGLAPSGRPLRTAKRVGRGVMIGLSRGQLSRQRRTGHGGLALLVALVLLAVIGAGGGAAQTPGAPPTPTTGAGPELSLSVSERSVPGARGSPTTPTVDLTISATAAVQVRLLQDGATLLFDGFVDGTPATLSRAFAAADCGSRHEFVLYSIVNGQAGRSASAALVLCPGRATPSPAPAARPPAAAATAAASAAAAPVPAAAAAAPTTAAGAAAPARSDVRPGFPAVPPPPLEPPSLALSHGFVLAEPDDLEAASAINAGVPLLKVLAIWLRGSDIGGGGDGRYQYVLIANLGGAAQSLGGWALQGDSGAIAGLTYYFPSSLTLAPGDSCRIYVGHPADSTCSDGSFALYPFWGDHGTASIWDDQQRLIDSLGY